MLNAFRSGGRSRVTAVVLWGLLGLLIVGLTGLGLGGAVSGLAGQYVARVGDTRVETDSFVRALDAQLNQFAQLTGQRMTMRQAQAFGIEQQVLGQLITGAALDDKAADLGLSVGDRAVRDELLSAQQFQGLDGTFDADSYQFFLDRSGLTVSEYEDRLREDLSRALLEVAVAGGVRMPDAMAETVLAFNREARRYAVIRLTEAALQTPLDTPSDADLQAHYDANPDVYTKPETRVVSYAALTPETVAAETDIAEADLRAAYDDRIDTYARPERRIVDLIAFASAEDAQAAKDAIDAGTQTYDDLAAERGLSGADLTLGALVEEDLSGAERDAVFGADEPGVIGPVETDLGPALYRLNAIIAAETRSFEAVADALRAELAAEEAADLVLESFDPVQDLLAAGATLEEVADETALSFGEIEITEVPGEGLAGDAVFRQEALAAEPGEERDAIELTDGGIAAVRVERVEPPALRPFDEVAETVRADWTAAETARRLAARAEELQGQLSEGRTLAAVAQAAGLDVESFGPIDRSARPEPGLPGAVVPTVFELDAGASDVLEADAAAVLVQVTEVIPFDAEAPENADALAALRNQLSGQLASDAYLSFAQALTDAAGVSVNQQLIADTLALYP
ncbi:MAG: SurA N-terminal domain-containing protein [Pseudomonadota bacterium]